MILVRDAAVENHPVIGIAALASSAVQISVRDKWINWSPSRFVEDLRTEATANHVEWLIRLVDQGVSGIYQDDLLDPGVGLISRRDLAKPTADMIGRLVHYARLQRQEHHRLVDARAHKRFLHEAAEPTETRWQIQAEMPLFRSKRAETLAMLLRARAVLYNHGRPLNALEFGESLELP